MANDQFFEQEGSRLLTPSAFEFVLDGELKRAVRSQNFLTLVVLETRREWEGLEVSADDGTVEAVAQVIGREVRDTDLLGKTDKGSPAGLAHRQLRLPDAPSDLGRRGVLPDARRRRRFIEAAGGLPSGRQLARGIVGTAKLHFSPLKEQQP
jgi:hypothetical protein